MMNSNKLMNTILTILFLVLGYHTFLYYTNPKIKTIQSEPIIQIVPDTTVGTQVAIKDSVRYIDQVRIVPREVITTIDHVVFDTVVVYDTVTVHLVMTPFDLKDKYWNANIKAFTKTEPVDSIQYTVIVDHEGFYNDEIKPRHDFELYKKDVMIDKQTSKKYKWAGIGLIGGILVGVLIGI